MSDLLNSRRGKPYYIGLYLIAGLCYYSPIFDIIFEPRFIRNPQVCLHVVVRMFSNNSLSFTALRTKCIPSLSLTDEPFQITDKNTDMHYQT